MEREARRWLYLMAIQIGNMLSNEASPYLRQHALDPVAWQPWNPDTLERAREEQRPILLSIGYSACHWCHVMQRESFQNQEIAKLMNQNFLCIKVDREERPDLDNIYQRAAALLVGQGGWPLTAFLTPETKPFFVGTYFPPDDRYGRSGFPTILTKLAQMWKDDSELVLKTADRLTQALAQESTLQVIPGLGGLSQLDVDRSDWPEDILQKAQVYLMTLYDTRHGGFGTAPKFPSVNLLRLFLQRSQKESALLEAVLDTLGHMASGGIYDQLGGGFHRYSTDGQWLVPHFEKMLYDNALLAQVYLVAYQLTGMEKYRRVVEETLEYLLRDMWHDDGGIFATEDADSEGVEGKFYTWNREELFELLGEEKGALLCSYYGIGDEDSYINGGFVLHQAMSLAALANQYGLSEAETGSLLESARSLLFQERQQRIRPFRDEKIITAWNGMAISAMAKAGAVLQISRYIDKAREIAHFGLDKLRQTDGRLLRSFRDGPSPVAGFLEDYSYFISGLLDLYWATLEPFWLEDVLDLVVVAISRFWSDEAGTFFGTEATEDLLFRPSSPEDESYPSAISVMARNLFYLQNLLPDHGKDKLETILRSYMKDMEANPWGFASLLAVLDLTRSGLREVYMTGPRRDIGYQELLRVLQATYLPDTVIYYSDLAPHYGSGLPELWTELWEGKIALDGKATVYICKARTCHAPITEPGELRKQLAMIFER